MYEDRARLTALWDEEVAAYRAARPESEKAWAAASEHLPDGVPMLWMAKGRARGPSSSSRRPARTSAASTGSTTSISASVTPERWSGTRPRRPSRRSPPSSDAARPSCSPPAMLRSRRASWPNVSVCREWQFTLWPPTPTGTCCATPGRRRGDRRSWSIDYCYHGPSTRRTRHWMPTARWSRDAGNIGPLGRRSTRRPSSSPFNDVRLWSAALADEQVAAVLDRTGHDQHRHRVAGRGWHAAVRAADERTGNPPGDRRDAHAVRRSWRDTARTGSSRTSWSSARRSAAASPRRPGG